MDTLLLLCRLDAFLVRGSDMLMQGVRGCVKIELCRLHQKLALGGLRVHWIHDQRFHPPFYNDVVIDLKRVRQGDIISPKLFSATLENVMRELEGEDVGVKDDGRQLHHLRFPGAIVLVTASISQAERMLADFDRVRGNFGLQLNPTKTIFMRNG
ncbi:unnamed protein product [Heligmosomoides polygyrus]|uniref:Reverse transcriptase domain-containing protein n=1 Tax=Heligmosomoides polygyrus TaxID=6339 RepID=A0A183FX78_HELPZ|nr:unnamed protein product [Heligmosomoides polygyrus]